MGLNLNAKYTPFWILSLFFVALLYLPWVFAPGMHCDGIAYATIGRNLAEGKGTFWAPFFSPSTFPGFYEHPPLVFGVESIFYRVFGDHLFVDKLYSFTCFLLSAWLLTRIWNLITNDKANAWVYLIFWVAIPLVPYVYANNFLENTMGVFCFASCLAMLYYLKTGSNHTFLIIMAGVLIALGFLSEGPLSLFPLALPGIYWIVFRKFPIKQAILCTLYIVVVLAVFFSILILWPASRHNLFTYLSTQVVQSLAGNRSTPGGRFFVANTLIYKLKPIYITVPVVLLLGAVFIRKRGVSPQYSSALFFLFLALSINLPVMASPKQFEQYILCAYAFYAMAAAALVFPYINFCVAQFINKGWVIKTLNVSFLMAISVALYIDINYQAPYMIDADKVKDIQNMQPFFAGIGDISSCDKLDGDWPLKTTLYRRFHINMVKGNGGDKYFIVSPDCIESVPAGYKKEFVGSKYILFSVENK